jgi:predicted XRE-type DNA-binding protein
MSKIPDRNVEESSGNVFADIGVRNPEEELAKAKLMLLIKRAVESQRLTQTQAAKRIGVAQSDISNIVRGRGRVYTMDKLFEVIHGLGGNIVIEAKVGTKKERIDVFG